MKPFTHRLITKKAIKLFGDDVYEKYIDIIAKGSYDENTKQLFTRLTNWHFYRANEKISKKFFWFVNPTSETIFKYRINEFQKEKNIEKKMYLLGKIVHHIQDMCTPSYIVPIFHLSNDYFETYLDKNIKSILENGTFSDSFYHFHSSNLYELYDDVASTASSCVLELGKPVSQRPYSIFWKSYDEKENRFLKGFGVFGDKHINFKNFDSLGEKDKKIIVDIHTKLIDLAIQSTNLALYFAKKYF